MFKTLSVAATLLFSASLMLAADPASPDIPASSTRDFAGRPVGNLSLPNVPLPTATQKQEVSQNLKDVKFDFDRYDLTMDDRATLTADAAWLKAHPEVYVTIEGDADERGDIVYNVTLSDRRAIATRDALVELGVPSDRILFAEGWGKLYPVCSLSDESCWSENRRAHFERW